MGTIITKKLIKIIAFNNENGNDTGSLHYVRDDGEQQTAPDHFASLVMTDKGKDIFVNFSAYQLISFLMATAGSLHYVRDDGEQQTAPDHFASLVMTDKGKDIFVNFSAYQLFNNNGWIASLRLQRRQKQRKRPDHFASLVMTSKGDDSILRRCLSLSLRKNS